MRGIAGAMIVCATDATSIATISPANTVRTLVSPAAAPPLSSLVSTAVSSRCAEIGREARTAPFRRSNPVARANRVQQRALRFRRART